MALRWEETAAILKQLETVFQSEDSDLVDTVAHQANECLAVLHAAQVDVKTSIRGEAHFAVCLGSPFHVVCEHIPELAKQMYGEDTVEGQQDRLSDGLKSATVAHTAALTSLQRVHSETAKEIQTLKAEEVAVKQELAAVTDAQKKTEVLSARLQSSRTADIPRVKCVNAVVLWCLWTMAVI